MGKVTRKRYGAEFKAKVALDAIKGELTLAELSAKHGIHQTMIAAWKRQAIEGLASTFSGKAEAAQATGEAELTRLARQDRPVGGGTGFFGEGLRSMSVERRREMIEASHPAPVGRPAVRAAADQPVRPLLPADWRERGDAGADAADRRGVPGVPVLRLAADDAAPAPAGSSSWPQPGCPADAQDGAAGDLPEAQYQRAASRAPGVSYLLRDLAIVRPNQVWCSDITYIPMRRGFLYLVAIMDWHSRRVLSWRLSNTMDVTFCTEALEEALARYGKPEIFNTDQGSQFTSLAFTQMLTDAGIQISMDGRGRWMDNVFIERLWRSLKYECVYLHAFETGLALHAGLLRWIGHYNTRRPHSSLAGRTPDEAYTQRLARRRRQGMPRRRRRA